MSTNIQTKIKKRDRQHPVVELTATTIKQNRASVMSVLDEDMLSLSVLMNQFKSEGKNISALKSDAEFQKFALNAISNCIDRLPMNEPQTIEVTCNMVEGGNGDFYWAPSDPAVLEKFLTPSFVIDSDLGEDDVNEFLNALSSYGFSTTAPPVPIVPTAPTEIDNPINQPSDDTPINPQPIEPNNETYNPNDTWLIQIYMCGTDLESGSHGGSFGAATTDIQEIMNVHLPPNIKVLIQTGGAKKWQRFNIPTNAIGRYLYDSNGWQTLSTNPDANMGDSKTLEDFIRYGEENFNADHKVLVFWDHGKVGLMGICVDENHGEDYLNMSKINSAFTKVYGSPQTPPFEIIGFDICLAGAYEYANAINGMARYMVASENGVPNPGFYYTGWLGALSKNPAMNGESLGIAMCNEFMIGIKQFDQRWKTNEIADATLSVVDMSKMPQIRAAVEEFGREALKLAQKNPRKFYSSFGVAALQAENYNGYNPETRKIKPNNVVDLYTLASEVQKYVPSFSKTVAGNLTRAIDSAVVYKVQGELKNRGGGVAGYHLYGGLGGDLRVYVAQPTNPDPQKQLYTNLLRNYGSIPGGLLQQGAASSPVGGKGSGMFDLSSTLKDVHVQVDGKNDAYVRLTEDQLETFSDVRCVLVKAIEDGEASLPDDDEEKILGIEDEGAIILGNGADTAGDWKRGTFRNNFRLKYPMLNGHHIFLDMLANNDNSTIYAVPIKLNGKGCYMSVAYFKDSHSYEIIDVRPGAEDNGVVSRDSIEIKDGDTIQALFIGMMPGKTEDSAVLKAVEGEPFIVDGKLTIENTALGDGEYGYTFQFVNPLGQSAYANEAVHLEIWKGKLDNISVKRQMTSDDVTINIGDNEVTISGIPTDSEED